MINRYPKNKLTIVGGGIVGALEAYFAYLDARKNQETIKITINERYEKKEDSTTFHIVPSLTADEIMAVIDFGEVLFKRLGIKFDEPNGIRVDDSQGVNDTEVSAHFKDQVRKYSEDTAGHQLRSRTLLEFGKYSMQLWQKLYDDADAELKRILEDSNFHPCRETHADRKRAMYEGYRIDLIYNIENATNKAENIKSDYSKLGYLNCKLLTPAEVIKLDSSLTHFCKANSHYNACGERVWRHTATAIWRPGGCIDTQIFLPKFYDYLKKVMGKYENNNGELKDCFSLKLGRNVTGVTAAATDNGQSTLTGLTLFGQTKPSSCGKKYNKPEYVFCPGEAVGTLKKLGFNEPAYAGFAGPSLMLAIPISETDLKKFARFSHYMEVHQEGVILSWQARIREGKVFIGVAGTKAYYSDQRPEVNQAFALNRNLLQLNMVNDVLPDFISLALGRNTKGKKLTAEDLNLLEAKQIAARWVGVRAVAYDGFPSLGYVYLGDRKVKNARCTTHLGSGGVSFAPASIFASRQAAKGDESSELINSVLKFADSSRRCI